jgi:hypothetical protein
VEHDIHSTTRFCSAHRNVFTTLYDSWIIRLCMESIFFTPGGNSSKFLVLMLVWYFAVRNTLCPAGSCCSVAQSYRFFVLKDIANKLEGIARNMGNCNLLAKSWIIHCKCRFVLFGCTKQRCCKTWSVKAFFLFAPNFACLTQSPAGYSSKPNDKNKYLVTAMLSFCILGKTITVTNIAYSCKLLPCVIS